MNKKIFFLIISIIFFSAGSVSAQTIQHLPVTAKGVAIYGWKDGEQIPIYVKKEHNLFPIASLTKLVTAKVAQEIYKPEEIFTISKAAASTYGITNGIKVGSIFTRDDLLKALLVNSSNDAAEALAEKAGRKTFMSMVNEVLHENKYTMTDFTNPSGLDPKQKNIKSNRMTPYHLTRLLNDIFQKDPLLVEIMDEEYAEIKDLKSNLPYIVKQTNSLYRDLSYRDKILMGKTGLTNLAGQNLAFVTDVNDQFDYITVVFLGSKNRLSDSKQIINWLTNYDHVQYGG